MNKIFCLILTALILSSGTKAFAQIEVPASLQVALFFKIFDFDRNLTDSPVQEILIGIFYDPQNPLSQRVKEEVKENFFQLASRKIGGRNIVIKEITDPCQLKGMAIVYVTPGSDTFIDTIVKKCQEYKTLSISGVERYAKQGLAIAIKLENRKPRIVINNTSILLCGINLSSKVLALAQIVGGGLV